MLELLCCSQRNSVFCILHKTTLNPCLLLPFHVCHLHICYCNLTYILLTRNPDGQCLKEIFIRLESGKHCQRRNAIDVISELFHLSSNSGNALPLSVRYEYFLMLSAVVSIVIHLCLDSSCNGTAFKVLLFAPNHCREDITQHLLGLLGDEEPATRVRVSNVFPQIGSLISNLLVLIGI